MGRLTENRLWTANAGLLLCDILKLNLDGFTNSGRRAEFDSDSFRRLLSEVKRVSELPRGEEAYRYVQILNPEGYVTFSNCFGGEGRLCGFPCPEGQSGASLRINESFAIYKRSAVRDGAWELICEAALMNPELGFSGVRGLLEADVSRLVGNRYQISQSGAVSSLLSGREPDPGKRLYVFDESEREKLMNLLEGAVCGADYFSPVLTIIREETSYYFSGAKSLDETVRLIQDRVGTYLAEIN